ncbi:MAG: hypothetical protein KDA83_03765 [Planctomycetales bacterium]|nr:hypothetical protein [Planctomycetales bacterium]
MPLIPHLFRPTSRLRGSLIAGLAAVTLVLGWAGSASAQRRPAAEILPDDTYLYIRAANVREFMEKSRDTAFGRMMADPEIAPLMENLYGMAADEFEQVRDQVGLSLDELFEIPQGEFCFAVVRNRDGDQPLAPVFLLDVGNSIDLAERLVGNGEAALFEQGVEPEEEDIDGTFVKVINGGNPDDRVVYFFRDGTFGVTNDLAVAEQLLARWDLQPTNRDKVFSNNRKFVAIMNRCRGTADARPDMTFFFDPYGMFQATQEGVSGAVATAFAKSIGVDGFSAVGGAYTVNVGEFEAIMHLHLLLASPRQGVVKMIAMRDGDLMAQDFIPADAVTFMTLNWDVDTTWDAFEEIFNKVSQSDTALDDTIETNINRRLGVDFKEDVIGNLTGRLTYSTWLVPPSRLNSQAIVFGAEVVDEEAAKETIAAIFEEVGLPENVEQVRYEGVEITKFPSPGNRRRFRVEVGPNGERTTRPLEEGEEPEDPFETGRLRRPEPCMAIYHNHILFSDSFDALKEYIACGEGRRDRLTDDPRYQETMDDIKRLMGDGTAGMMIYQQPEAILENFYNLAVDQENRNSLRQAGENNRQLRRLDEVLNETPLPPFDVFKKYFSANGGVFSDDSTGIHYFTYQRRLD